MSHDYRTLMPALANAMGMPLFEESGGIEALLPYMEKMRQEGAVVVLKLDGQRHGDDNGAYTAVVSGGLLGDDYFRTDAGALAEAAAYVIVNYAHKCWGFNWA